MDRRFELPVWTDATLAAAVVRLEDELWPAVELTPEFQARLEVAVGRALAARRARLEGVSGP